MLFLVRMEISLPRDAEPQWLDELKVSEKARAGELQRMGKWIHLWRVVGRFANVGVFDVDSNDELHTLISSLPFYPFMDITVIPLARHPSAIEKEN